MNIKIFSLFILLAGFFWGLSNAPNSDKTELNLALERYLDIYDEAEEYERFQKLPPLSELESILESRITAKIENEELQQRLQAEMYVYLARDVFPPREITNAEREARMRFKPMQWAVEHAQEDIEDFHQLKMEAEQALEAYPVIAHPDFDMNNAETYHLDERYHQLETRSGIKAHVVLFSFLLIVFLFPVVGWVCVAAFAASRWGSK